MKGLTFHLQSEFSYGRWGGDDVFGLTDPLLAVVSRLSMHFDFSFRSPALILAHRRIVKLCQAPPRGAVSTRGIRLYARA